MKQAIVAVEDKRFYEHNGVDVRGILRAAWEDIRSKSVVEGGSTITQQYVKNAYSRNDQTIARKVREAALAWQLTQRWSKDRILTAYLNTIYFGNGAYGILQAARTYFEGKSARGADAPRGSAARGDPRQPRALRPRAAPRGRTSAACVRPRPALRAGPDHRRRAAQGERHAAAQARGRRAARDAGAGAVLRQLRHRPARRAVPRGARVRRRARGHDDDRPRPPGEGAARRSRRSCATRTGPRRRWSRSIHARAPSRRCSAERTSGAASSTSRRRRSASLGRPSSRSC